MKHACKLPASHNVFRQLATFVEELLSRANRQLINAADIQDVRLVITGNGPFRLLIELVLRTKVECRKTSIGVGHGFRQCVGNQEAQSGGEALLRLDLKSVVEGSTSRIEVITNSAARFAGIVHWIWEQCLGQASAGPIVTHKITIGSE